VCSVHFPDEEPTEENPYPTLVLGHNSTPKCKARRQLSKHPVPKKRRRIATDPMVSDNPVAIEVKLMNIDMENATETPTRVQDPNGTKSKARVLKQLHKNIGSQDVTADNLLATDKKVRFYTGIQSKAVFDLLYEYVQPKVEKMNYWRGSSTTKDAMKVFTRKRGRRRKLQQKDEMLLTLMKLRLGLLNEDIAYRFDIAESTVSSIFTTWIKVLASVLEPTIRTPPPECIRPNLPRCFSKYKNLRGILDCTEVFIERPRDLKLQALTWSDYKKHNTIKFLVVMTPRGRISFLSSVWGGRASDRHIVLNSSFMSTVEPYDQYMVDRGFNIREDLLTKYADLIIPPGARGKEQMSGADVNKTKSIANLRIHIERAIERIKRYRILQCILPISLLPLADDIIQTCGGLCNLLGPLVK